jgi:hypothetical protein
MRSANPTTHHDEELTMRNATTDTKTLPATQTIDTAKLDDVTGGCAACGTPGGVCQLSLLNRWGRPQPTEA